MKAKEANEPVSTRIRILLEEKGLKQNVIAKRSGFTPQNFNNMLMGRKLIRVCDIQSIAKAIGAEVNELFYSSKRKGEMTWEEVAESPNPKQ